MSANSPERQTIDWGLTPYAESLERQLAVVEQRIAGNMPDTLILCEHPATYTFGARPGADQHLLVSSETLQREGIAVHRTTRGGDVTAHNPGQQVAYPIVSLDKHRDLHAFLRLLEESILKTLAHFEIQGERREGKTGIWLGTRKIAAIGVAARSWVTYHGLAINVNNDTAFFDGIIPCGISTADGTVTSLSRELGGGSIDINKVKSVLTVEFWQLFETFQKT
ncbi:MAG: lipoyl(octanoyl) transferase LipB [Puniceicoccales bacterium]|jgi:lipoyl(octanoyl) transferase|nr:lipoyl(octanoyl) transferase LipB [Puniceicoccales bacterium]